MCRSRSHPRAERARPDRVAPVHGAHERGERAERRARSAVGAHGAHRAGGRVVEIVALHPEYHGLLENVERYVDRDWTPEGGTTNPFLHLSLHLAVAEQLAIDQPPGIRGEYERIVRARGDAHAALAEPASVVVRSARRGRLAEGETVAVIGAGNIGLLTVEVARAMGAHATINVARDADWVQRYSADKGSFDVMIECSGNERALRNGLETMRPRGTVVQLGLGGDVSLPQNLVVSKELNICGSFRFHPEFALAVKLINDGRVDLSPVITGAFPKSQAREAFLLAGDRQKAMKVMIDFEAA